MKTTQKGDITELQVALVLINQGLTVLKPWTEDCRYDLVVEEEAGFTKVQCKTGRLRDGAIRFTCCSSDNITYKKQSYHGQADVFGVYCFETDQVYFVPVDEAATKNTHLRVEPAANGQQQGIRLAKDYLQWPRKRRNGLLEPSKGQEH